VVTREVKGAFSEVLNIAAEVVPRLEMPIRELYAATFTPFTSFRNEQFAIVAMSKLINSTSCCVDVGAHKGDILHHMRRFAPEGKFFAFEPLDSFFAKLQKAHVKSTNVTLYNLALSYSAGTRTFEHVVQEPGKSSFKIAKNGHVEVTESVQVKTATMDETLPEGQVIDFIKIDVEGAEFEVLQGAKKTLLRCRPAILFEHHELAAKPYGDFTESMFQYLTGDFGYKIYTAEDYCHGGKPLAAESFSAEFKLGKNVDFIAIT